VMNARNPGRHSMGHGRALNLNQRTSPRLRGPPPPPPANPKLDNEGNVWGVGKSVEAVERGDAVGIKVREGG